MPMVNSGTSKLLEECGELATEVAKFQAFGLGHHPDGKGDIKTRMEIEIADVLAAITFVGVKLKFDFELINTLSRVKLAQYQQWDKEPEEPDNAS